MFELETSNKDDLDRGVRFTVYVKDRGYIDNAGEFSNNPYLHKKSVAVALMFDCMQKGYMDITLNPSSLAA